MNAIPFDTLKLAQALKEASFTPEQAEGAARAIADAAQSDLATRTDLDGLRKELTAEAATIRAEINAARVETMRWIGAQTIVIIAAVAGVVRFLH